MGEFADKVFEAVCQVPRGCVATYGQIAALVGRPRSARYVGFALRTNPRPGVAPDSIPCHRIVFKDGSLCKGFAFGGPDVQYQRLAGEGVSFIEVAGSDAGERSDDGAVIEADLADGKGMRPVRLADIRVDMEACCWDARPAGAGAGARNLDDSASDRGGYPTEPPAFFDWKAEMGD